jgi:hypothetical protein
MRRAHQIVSVILLFLAQSLSAAQPLGAGQMEEADPLSVFSQLKTTLSKLYPIEHWAISSKADAAYPFAPRFCWVYFRPDPETLGRLGEAIRDYKSSVSWVIGPPLNNATCLVAAKQGLGQFVGYPSIDRPAERQPLPTGEFVDQALADVPNLCAHLEQYLRLEHLAAKSFDSGLISPPDPPSADVAPFDFVERGMHVAWIVYTGRIEGREREGTSSGDRHMLHFSVTTKEWRQIEAELFDGATTAGVARSRNGAFPLLAKIQESESVYFRGAEVATLRQECLRARASTSKPLAIRGLDKLILLCNWAQHGAGDILLRAP